MTKTISATATQLVPHANNARNESLANAVEIISQSILDRIEGGGTELEFESSDVEFDHLVNHFTCRGYFVVRIEKDGRYSYADVSNNTKISW